MNVRAYMKQYLVSALVVICILVIPAIAYIGAQRAEVRREKNRSVCVAINQSHDAFVGLQKYFQGFVKPGDIQAQKFVDGLPIPKHVDC